MKLEEQLPGAD